MRRSALGARVRRGETGSAEHHGARAEGDGGGLRDARHHFLLADSGSAAAGRATALPLQRRNREPVTANIPGSPLLKGKGCFAGWMTVLVSGGRWFRRRRTTFAAVVPVSADGGCDTVTKLTFQECCAYGRFDCQNLRKPSTLTTVSDQSITDCSDMKKER
ncbi:hypothetical protein GCM10023336_57430 [Streptomyces similanensis]|uniref:Uncharacterized protein n=1 Tax=Streptomyces similanensis TaxID=1274988 RepID=A0ABP9L994_9ACTN